MINYIEINIDCLHQYDCAIPDDIVFEHRLKYYSVDRSARLPMVKIEVRGNNNLVVIQDGFYIDIAKKLGIKTIRAVLLNSSDRILLLFDECIPIKDLRKTFENEEKNASFNEIYRLIYFRNRLAIQDYESIGLSLNSFVVDNDMEAYSISHNFAENYIELHLKTTKRRFLDNANQLYIFLSNLNDIYKIDTLNGIKISSKQGFQ